MVEYFYVAEKGRNGTFEKPMKYLKKIVLYNVKPLEC
jgi:hypothetical protein